MTVRSQKPLVLIVEDNSTNIDLLVNSLKNDYHLGIAKNGPKAIE
jgi:putative two-component system response regulator